MWGKDAWRVFAKDMRVEMRSKELLITVSFFALILIVVFSVGFVPQGEINQADDIARRALPGVIWVTIAFCGVLGLGKAFARELTGDTMRALLLTPMSRSAIFAGKTLAIAVYMLLVEAVVVLFATLFFNAPVGENFGWLCLFLLLGTFGFATVGSLFSAVLLRSKARDVLLPVILFPILMPLLLAAAKGTSAILQMPMDAASMTSWLKFLLAYDIFMLIAAMWTFDSAITE